VIAEFISYSRNGISAEYIFNVKEVLRGDVPENPIHVFEEYINVGVGGYSYISGIDRYTVGREYVLILERLDSIFYDCPRYLSIEANFYIPADDTASGTMYGELISKQIDGDIITLIRETPLDKDEESRPSYTESEDMEEIIDFSDVVMEVKITSLIGEGLHNGSPYFCEIVKVLKGKPAKKVGEIVIITILKGSVEVGGHYLVMVTQAGGETSTIHTQSSLKSVISMDDTEAVAEVRRILEWVGD
jgi:hypothetical protein